MQKDDNTFRRASKGFLGTRELLWEQGENNNFLKDKKNMYHLLGGSFQFIFVTLTISLIDYYDIKRQ